MKRFLCSVLFVLCFPAHAGLVAHELVLTVDLVTDNTGAPPACVPGTVRFGCVTPGSVFVGQFYVEDSLLTQEGDNLLGDMWGFFLTIGGVTWDQDRPSDFLGFKRFNPCCTGDPGFDVHGGVLTGLQGGVFGHLDFPFVDFLANNRFLAAEGLRLHGDLSIQRVSEPSVLFLLAIALLGVANAFKQTARIEVPKRDADCR